MAHVPLYHGLAQLDRHLDFLRTKTSQSSLFLVGGCIRDHLLGINNDPTDIDVTLAGHPLDIKNQIDQSGISFFMTEKYGTMTLVKKGSDDQPTYSYEITPFRGEGNYSDARHPDEISWDASLLEDAQRRDFTINALYYTTIGECTINTQKVETNSCTDILETDHKTSEEASKRQDKTLVTMQKALQKAGAWYDDVTQVMVLTSPDLIQIFLDAQGDWSTYIQWCQAFFGEIDRSTVQGLRVVLDPTQGVIDLINGTLRAVGNPHQRIQEDALRIIRALRFVTVLNPQLTRDIGHHAFDIQRETRKALQKRYFLTRTLPAERIKQEMDKVFVKGNPFGFVGLCDEINILQYIFPALHANKNVDQPVRYHPFDVYTHCLMTLHHFQSINNDRLARYAMLYHDVGKREQYHTYRMGLDQDGVREMFGTWLNHINCGADMAHDDFSSLSFSKKDVATIRRYVAWHMKPGEIAMSKPSSRKKKIRGLVSEVGPEMVHNLLDMTIADRRGQYNPLQGPQIHDINTLHHLVDEIMEDEGRFTMAQLEINGHDLMDHCGRQGGPRLRPLLDKIFQRVSDDIGHRNNKKKILKELDAWHKNGEIEW